MACHEQTLQLITKIRKLRTKGYITLAPALCPVSSHYSITMYILGPMFFVFSVYAGSGSGQTQNIESQILLYSVCWGGNKWSRRPLGGELQYRALRPLCEGLFGGSSVEEGIGQPAGVPQEVMEWMATITGDHVGYPGFQDFDKFSPRRKFFGEQKFAHLSHQISSLFFWAQCYKTFFCP